jgi:hypothetical protein
MRLAAVVGLIVILLAQAWIRSLWVLDYQWRRAAYLEKCENKQQPQLKCDGKCYLLKQIKTSETGDQNAPPLPEALKEWKEPVLFIDHLTLWEEGGRFRQARPSYPPYVFSLICAATGAVFQPPEL